jgi:hypothetical protein
MISKFDKPGNIVSETKTQLRNKKAFELFCGIKISRCFCNNDSWLPSSTMKKSTLIVVEFF